MAAVASSLRHAALSVMAACDTFVPVFSLLFMFQSPVAIVVYSLPSTTITFVKNIYHLALACLWFPVATDQRTFQKYILFEVLDEAIRLASLAIRRWEAD